MKHHNFMTPSLLYYYFLSTTDRK